MEDFPKTIVELSNKRKDNLFYFNDIHKPLFNNYSAPGIKNIKVLLFNYITDENNNIEPVRWKLVTTRVFLDIPINQFPDFGEVGGADYTTIPWPYTTAIIGGVSQDSKYFKSIDDTLGGGKIGDLDIIDETFLVDAKDNSELGVNIQVMDLEQIRYFNKSYGINELLKIPTTIRNQDISPELLSTLPFPEFQEEFDIVGDFDTILGEVNVSDSIAWTVAGRPDIFDYINSLVNNETIDSIPIASEEGVTPRPVEDFYNPTYGDPYYDNLYNALNEDGTNYWDGESLITTFSEESSVGQIFISDNLDLDLKENCKLELNMGELSGKSILDSSGNSNKGLLIGDYKVKKTKKGEPMRRDSFIKVPKKTGNKDGAL
jgi:hypothetical protein